MHTNTDIVPPGSHCWLAYAHVKECWEPLICDRD